MEAPVDDDGRYGNTPSPMASLMLSSSLAAGDISLAEDPCLVREGSDGQGGSPRRRGSSGAKSRRHLEQGRHWCHWSLPKAKC